ncbi:Gibberellin-regulated protein 9 [Hibiscus syriacus]|uniref:Gibberellin-regulated protein 9 n=1 Tax=Hibiscus syriacus TaxID=106335 RepID=A0A6A2YBW6_HIBSY|nr:gibberellin-regulated protein 14-like [Hibiscus syriacus]KAE8672429.1 Gibberellin-regulated protein 9 [Hibiscus syriacus]
MASKAQLFLLVTLLLLATQVSTNESEEKIEMKYVKVPEPAAPIPVKPPSPTPPAPAPPVKAPTPPYKPTTPAPPTTTPPPPYKPPSPPLPPVKTRKDCIPLCGERCKLHSRTNLCMRACITCCDRCKCVPPGTYGNREMCGKCYTEMKTHNNKPKCP